ncbi:hypothetical protein GpartN1_g6590.t1 [Galdieria partita]|uniref:Ribonuclease n=1 Tax=Galdieria partita TaxID=83374 RepID=A0A9C7UT30_9RHOD|nr:hypothetical protein GpartN1_g6590.t1 [Galdieria partita]
MRWLYYPCFRRVSSLLYKMPKRKSTITNPLCFKRHGVVCQQQAPSSYRWIGIDQSEKTIKLRGSIDHKIELEESHSDMREELIRVLQLTQEERKWRNKGYQVIVGVDEAGRGPLAGPVVAAACILPPDVLFEGLNDSKKLTPSQRNILYENIQKYAIEYAIGQVDHHTIDQVNIFQATMMAVQDALKQLRTKPDMVIADGPHWKLTLDIPLVGVIKGDNTILSVCAASILAKETRDRWMIKASLDYPEYGFEKHKGYGTAFHLKAIQTFGPSALHRMSFRPLCEVKPDSTSKRRRKPLNGNE